MNAGNKKIRVMCGLKITTGELRLNDFGLLPKC